MAIKIFDRPDGTVGKVYKRYVDSVVDKENPPKPFVWQVLASSGLIIQSGAELTETEAIERVSTAGI